MNSAGGGRRGPTVVLVGGEMTTDDGSHLDSRQSLEADQRSEVMLRTLSTSLLWWRATASVVTPILLSAGCDRPALVVSGTRSVLELNEDGTHRRTRLSGLLPGGTTTTEFIRAVDDDGLPAGYQKAAVLRDWIDDHYIATIGWKPGKRGKQWHFLRSDFYLAHCIGVVAPGVVVDASVSMFEGSIRTERGPDGSARIHGAVGHRFRAFEQSRLYRPDAVLVLPHTSANEMFLTRYSNWVAAGRPSTVSENEDYSWMRSAWQLACEGGGPSTAPDQMERTLPTPIDANFRVTGLMEDAQWQDASHLEASRALLQARYDLKIGIWDLARNPILRKTLLNATPIQAAPATPAAVPPAARLRAVERVNRTLARRDTDRETWLRVLANFDPLTQLGWIPDAEPTRGRKWHLYLPLTRPYLDYGQAEPGPLAQLHMSFSMRHNAVELTARQRGLVGLEAFLRTRTQAFEWAENVGWGDDLDWDTWVAAMATRTLGWLKTFAPLREVYERLNDDPPPTLHLANLPVLCSAPMAEPSSPLRCEASRKPKPANTSPPSMSAITSPYAESPEMLTTLTPSPSTASTVAYSATSPIRSRGCLHP